MKNITNKFLKSLCYISLTLLISFGFIAIVAASGDSQSPSNPARNIAAIINLLLSDSRPQSPNQVWQSFESIAGTGIYSEQLIIDSTDENKIYSSYSYTSGAAIVNYNNNTITSFLPRTSIAIDPNNNSHFLARAVWPFDIDESLDGGNSWNPICHNGDTPINPNSHYLQYSPDGKVVYCYSDQPWTGYGGSTGWYFVSSVDNGRTWIVPAGFYEGSGVGPIAISNTKPNIVFAKVFPFPGGFGNVNRKLTICDNPILTTPER